MCCCRPSPPLCMWSLPMWRHTAWIHQPQSLSHQNRNKLLIQDKQPHQLHALAQQQKSGALQAACQKQQVRSPAAVCILRPQAHSTQLIPPMLIHSQITLLELQISSKTQIQLKLMTDVIMVQLGFQVVRAWPPQMEQNTARKERRSVGR